MSSFSIRRSGNLPAAMVQALDFIAVCAGGWLAYQLRFGSLEALAEPSSAERMMVLGTAAFATLFFSKIYRMWPGGSLAAMVGRVTLGWVMTWTGIVVLLFLTKSAESFSRLWLVTWLLTAVVTLWLGRLVSFIVLAQMRRAGYQLKKVLLYGDTHMLHTARRRIEEATWSGYEIAGIVAPNEFETLATLDAKLKPDEIWISMGLGEQAQLENIINSLDRSVANIRLLPDMMMYQILNHGMSVNLGIPMVDLSLSPMFGERAFIKRMEDVVVATLALLLLSPLMITIAIAVKLTSKGPVLFKQKRHGWNDEEIYVYKFRSMKVHEEQTGKVTQAQRMDPRVTPLGRFLRKTSLDELPQFINVLQGRMSVVGPRPHALEHNSEYVKLIPRYALRHKVKPGITGWAQICGYRGETDTIDKMEGRVQHDLFYLENWSLWLDLKIIVTTPIATIQNKNVY
nr:undecaprenyl-phosphate glucose phosphotransferase [uncultured Rhodoferax sp.]